MGTLGRNKHGGRLESKGFFPSRQYYMQESHREVDCLDHQHGVSSECLFQRTEKLIRE